MWNPLMSLLRHSWRKHLPTRRKPARTRLTVEALEDRSVPATFAAGTAADLITDINAANLTGGANTINLLAGVNYTLTAVNNTTDGTNGLPVIAPGNQLTIVGNNAILMRSSALDTPNFRLLDVADGASLTIDHLTIQGGRETAYSTSLTNHTLAFGESQGGGILNHGTLNMTVVIVEECQVQGADSLGGLFAPVLSGDGSGGGLYSTGTVFLENCQFHDNSAIGGAGLAAHVGNADSGGANASYSGTNGGNGSGGGVFVAGGSFQAVHSTFDGNAATGGIGGAKSGVLKKGKPGTGIGGGVYIAAGTVTLDAFTKKHFSANAASTQDNDIHGTYTLD